MTFGYCGIKDRFVLCFLAMIVKFHLCIESYRSDTLSKKSFITSSGPNLHLQKHRDYKFRCIN